MNLGLCGWPPHCGHNHIWMSSRLIILSIYDCVSFTKINIFCCLFYTFIVFISRAANRVMLLQSSYGYAAETGATDLQASDYSMDAAVARAVPPLKTLCIEPPSYFETMAMFHLQNKNSNGQMNTEDGNEQCTRGGRSEHLQTPALASCGNPCKF